MMYVHVYGKFVGLKYGYAVDIIEDKHICNHYTFDNYKSALMCAWALSYKLQEEKMKLERPAGGFGEFLKPTHIKGKTEATILAFRKAPKSMEYSDFCLDVKIGKNQFTMGIRAQAPNLARIIDLLGDETDEWTGKKITLVKSKWNKKNVIRIA